MSYILDALRKADAERERGSVPGLHAQPQRAGGTAADAPRSGRLSPAWWLSGVLLLALGGLAGAWWLRGSDAPAAPTAAAPVAALPATPQPLPAALPPAALPAPAALPGAAPVLRAAPPALPAAPPARMAPEKRHKPETPAVAAAPAAPSPAPAPASAAVPAQAIAKKPDTRLPSSRELPEDLRRDLPALSVNGASYSETAANRLLIVNGQLFHEGDAIGPDHVLEQIRLKSAVLRFRGVRYVLEY